MSALFILYIILFITIIILIINLLVETSHHPTKTPGMKTPGMKTPGITTPGITTPGLTTPGLTTPGFTTPGVTTPGVTTPGFTTPGITTPGLKTGLKTPITTPETSGYTYPDPGIVYTQIQNGYQIEFINTNIYYNKYIVSYDPIQSELPVILNDPITQTSNNILKTKNGIFTLTFDNKKLYTATEMQSISISQNKSLYNSPLNTYVITAIEMNGNINTINLTINSSNIINDYFYPPNIITIPYEFTIIFGSNEIQIKNGPTYKYKNYYNEVPT